MHPELMRALAVDRQRYLRENADRVPRRWDTARPS